jgi:cell division protein FtsW (lipid II flippase)
MKRVFQILHHRSLSASIVALFFALLAFGLLPEHAYRIRQQGAAFLRHAGTMALIGCLVCVFTLIMLLRDNRSGYPPHRCSIATLLWALACVPIFLLAVVVIGELLK